MQDNRAVTRVPVYEEKTIMHFDVFPGQRTLNSAFQQALKDTKGWTLSRDFQNCVNEALEREQEP